MEYTEKLGFPIPEVTRAGDVNDVIDIVTTIEAILEYIDAGSGDYNVGVSSAEMMEETLIPTGEVVPLSTLIGEGNIYFPDHNPNEGYDDTKIGWIEGGESAYLKINDNGSITIKKAGNYNIIPNLWFTSDTDEGDVYLLITRDDVQDSVNTSYIFKVKESLAGESMYATMGGEGRFAHGVIGPHFFQEGANVEVCVFITNEAATVNVGLTSIAAERL